MTPRRPVWPWIVATVIAVPVLYVASFGPMFRYSPWGLPWWYAEPYLWLSQTLPASLGRWLHAYLAWWGAP